MKRQSSMFQICFHRVVNAGERNWWWPISISLCRPPKVTSRYQRTGSALLKCPSKLSSSTKFQQSSEFVFLDGIKVGSEIVQISRSRLAEIFFITAPECKYRNPIESYKHFAVVVGVTCWIVFHMWIVDVDNLYWQRVYLFSVSYQTPAATTFLSRQSFAIYRGLSHLQKPTTWTRFIRWLHSHTCAHMKSL